MHPLCDVEACRSEANKNPIYRAPQPLYTAGFSNPGQVVIEPAEAHMRDSASLPSISCGVLLAHRSLVGSYPFQSLRGTDSCSRHRRQRPQAEYLTTFTDASGKVSRCQQVSIAQRC